MGTRDDPGVVHIPDTAGRPICGAPLGRTSVLLMRSECPACQARVPLTGMKPQDAFNPAHPVGRLLMGASFGLPGFPKIPGVWRRFRGGGD